MDFKKEPKFPRLVLVLTILLVGAMFWFFSRGHSSSEQSNGANGELVTLLLDSVNATATLAWNPNPEPDVIGYSLGYGLVPGVYTQQYPPTGTTTSTMVSVSGLSSGTPYFFAVRALNSGGAWSGYSNEVSWVATSSPTPAAPDFSLSVYPDSRIIPLTGGLAPYTLTVVPLNGFTGTVFLNASGLPFGTTNAGRLGQGTMVIYVASCTVPGNYPFTFTGTSTDCALVHTIDATLVKQ